MRAILVILLFNTLVTFGQGKDNNSCLADIDTLTNRQVYKMVDKMPSVDGGMSELFNLISKWLKYPQAANPVGSKILVAFVVESTGEITRKRVIRNIDGTDLAEQLLEVVDDLKWQPGMCNGKPVPALLQIPMYICVK